MKTYDIALVDALRLSVNGDDEPRKWHGGGEALIVSVSSTALVSTGSRAGEPACQPPGEGP